MVSTSEGTHLSVIQGLKGQEQCAGHCKHDDEQADAKEPSTAQNPPVIAARYDEALKQLLTAKLAHSHLIQRTALENQMRELGFQLTLEKLTFEAALDGVPVKHIEESHEQAFEALEAAQNKVA